MEARLGQPADEIKRLQRCINDLVSVLALPAIWVGADPGRIVSTLLDVLLGLLSLDLVYVRMKDPLGEASIEMARVAQSSLAGRTPTLRPQEIGAQLSAWLGDDPLRSPRFVRNPVGEGELAVVALRLGLQGEIGVLVAGAQRADFPEQTERLLLTVAANQAVIGLQEARLLGEQKRESELNLHQLRITQAELTHMARVMTMGELTASIAHEVNQPLAGILTNASTCLRMLAADPPNLDGARETARRTIRDGNRASEVITRLRSLYSKKDATTELMDLNDATREVIALSLSELQRNDVVLRPALADDLPPILGDRVQLQQVILNLLRNASDAMSGVDDRPRQLLIRTEREAGDRVRLTVQDTGVGFDPQAVHRLFQPFYTTKSDGMGLGLSVSRSIIEGHQGRLWATLNEGPGATFAFSIPHNAELVRRTSVAQ
jgi:signal transduction histidine kinase